MDKYRNLIWATAIIVGTTLVTLLLIYDNLKRRSIQKALVASNAKLTATYKELETVEGTLRRQYEVMAEHDREVGELNQKFELAIEGTNSAVWEVDLTSKTVSFAGDCSRISNRILSNHCHVHYWMDSVLESSHRERLITEVSNYLQGKSAQIQYSGADGWLPDTQQKWLLIRGKGIKSADGNFCKLHGILLDNTKFKLQEEQIRHLARHDFNPATQPDRAFDCSWKKNWRWPYRGGVASGY